MEYYRQTVERCAIQRRPGAVSIAFLATSKQPMYVLYGPALRMLFKFRNEHVKSEGGISLNDSRPSRDLLWVGGSNC
jgi:hypothetical protein